MPSTRFDRPAIGSAARATTIAVVALALAVLVGLAQYLPDLALEVRTATDVSAAPLGYLGRDWFWVAVTMTVLGAGVAATADTRPRLGPAHTTPRIAALAVATPIVLVAGLLLATAVLGTGLSDVARVAWPGSAGGTSLLATAVVPAALLGAAATALFVGGVQHRLQTAFPAGPTVAVTTLLAGFCHWLLDPLSSTVAGPVVRLGVLALVVGAATTPYVLAGIRPAATVTDALTPVRVAVLLAATVLCVGLAIDVLTGATTPAELAVATAWFAVYGVATTLYARSDGLAWPAVTLVGFQALVFLAPHLESWTGLTG